MINKKANQYLVKRKALEKVAKSQNLQQRLQALGDSVSKWWNDPKNEQVRDYGVGIGGGFLGGGILNKLMGGSFLRGGVTGGIIGGLGTAGYRNMLGKQRAIQQDMQSKHNAEVNAIEDQLGQANKDNTALQSRVESLTADNSGLSSALQQSESNAAAERIRAAQEQAKLTEELSDRNAQIGSLTDDLAKSKASLEESNKVVRTLQDKVKQGEISLAEARTIISQLESDPEYLHLRGSLLDMSNRLSEANQQLEDNQPLVQRMQNIDKNDTTRLAFVINYLKKSGYPQKGIDKIIQHYLDNPSGLSLFAQGFDQHSEDIANAIVTGSDKLRRAGNAAWSELRK